MEIRILLISRAHVFITVQSNLRGFFLYFSKWKIWEIHWRNNCIWHFFANIVNIFKITRIYFIITRTTILRNDACNDSSVYLVIIRNNNIVFYTRSKELCYVVLTNFRQQGIFLLNYREKDKRQMPNSYNSSVELMSHINASIWFIVIHR